MPETKATLLQLISGRYRLQLERHEDTFTLEVGMPDEKGFVIGNRIGLDTDDLGDLRHAIDGAIDRLPADVARLVIAARDVAYGGRFDSDDPEKIALITELDKAAEAFAERVAWDDEPKA